ncbi:hypothetical protein FI667_g15320, partial [Globisporangium splendens]
MAALSLTPRSTRLLALSNQDEVFEVDDYEAAKKRCCKVSTRKTMVNSQRPACVTQHESLPLVIVTLDGTNVESETQSKIELHAYNSVTFHIFQISGVNTPHFSGTAAAIALISIQLIASAKFPALVGVELSPDAQFVALSAASGGITVFKLPNELDVAESGEGLSPVDLNSSSAFMLIGNDVVPGTSSLVKAHFLVTPSLSSSTTIYDKPMEAYAIVVCCRTKLQKYLLPNRCPPSKISSAQTPSHSWDRVAPITTSATDSTTQYLTVILENGSVIVWDVLVETDHAYLPPCSATAKTLRALASKADSVPDALVIFRDEYVVAFSASTQQVCFYDIKDQAKVQLLRVVTPPAAPSSRLRSTSDGVSILLLVKTTRVLDVPIAMVGYSNGFLVLYDMRNAEAIGSI